jgi:hypothetical protein
LLTNVNSKNLLIKSAITAYGEKINEVYQREILLPSLIEHKIRVENYFAQSWVGKYFCDSDKIKFDSM